MISEGLKSNSTLKILNLWGEGEYKKWKKKKKEHNRIEQKEKRNKQIMEQDQKELE